MEVLFPVDITQKLNFQRAVNIESLEGVPTVVCVI